MINIAHLYAYYKRYDDLEKALDDDIVQLESSEGETVLNILLSQNKPNYGIVIKWIKLMLLQAGNQKESTLDHQDKSRCFYIYRQLERILPELNKAQVPELTEIYEALRLKIEIEPLAIEKTQQYADKNPEFQKDKIKETLKPKEKAEYEVSAVKLDLALATERTQKTVLSLINLRDQNILGLEFIKRYTNELWNRSFKYI